MISLESLWLIMASMKSLARCTPVNNFFVAARLTAVRLNSLVSDSTLPDKQLAASHQHRSGEAAVCGMQDIWDLICH